MPGEALLGAARPGEALQSKARGLRPIGTEDTKQHRGGARRGDAWRVEAWRCMARQGNARFVFLHGG
jgi:hypothetical protein